jgi:hypothetical protein
MLCVGYSLINALEKTGDNQVCYSIRTNQPVPSGRILTAAANLAFLTIVVGM